MANPMIVGGSFPTVDIVQGITEDIVDSFPNLTDPADSSDGFIADQNDTGSENKYNIFEYLEGLLASQGAENAINRQYNSIEAQSQRDWASKENQDNRDWQTYMSNTSYSRAVADLKNAGLNPILALSSGFGGANTGNSVSTSGSSSNYQTAGGDSLGSLAHSLGSLLSGLGSTLNGLSELAPSLLDILVG